MKVGRLSFRMIPKGMRGQNVIPAGTRVKGSPKPMPADQVEVQVANRVAANPPKEPILSWTVLQMPRGLMTSAMTTVDLRRVARVVTPKQKNRIERGPVQ